MSRAFRGSLTLLGWALVVGFAFAQGVLFANKRATVRLANDECFLALNGLTAMNDPLNRKLAVNFLRKPRNQSADSRK